MKRRQLSLILKMAARGYTLAKYLHDAGIHESAVQIKSMVAEIMELREHAAAIRPSTLTSKHRPFDVDLVSPDIHIHLHKDGGHTATGFDIVEKK